MHDGTSYTSGPWLSMPIIGATKKAPQFCHIPPRGGQHPHRESLVVWVPLEQDPMGDFKYVGALRPGDTEQPCDLVSPLCAGAEDQRALDSVLRDPQCFRARVQLDPGAPGPGGLWNRRGPPVVSKYPPSSGLAARQPVTCVRASKAHS